MFGLDQLKSSELKLEYVFQHFFALYVNEVQRQWVDFVTPLVNYKPFPHSQSLTDHAISSPAPLVTYFQKMGELYEIFSIHTKKQYSLDKSLKVLESILCYFRNDSEKVRNTFKLQGIMQGPQGVM